MTRKKVSNYRLLDNYAHYVPGPLPLLGLSLFFLMGIVAANGVVFLVRKYLGDAGMEYGTLISYPLMFLPAMLYALPQWLVLLCRLIW